MIHVRVVSPPGVTSRLVPALLSEPCVLNLTVLPRSVRKPDADAVDAVQFDVLRGAANEILDRLRQLGLDSSGSIVVQPVDVSISAAQVRAGVGRSRFFDFAPVWEEVEARIRADGRFPPSWYLLLMIAGLIATVGLLTNSQILIVGAMVVGPEYGAIVAMAYGLTRRKWGRVTQSALALTSGFALAVIASFLLSSAIRAAGLAPDAFTHGLRPVSHLIDTPDWFSVLVAVLAGLVGVISLTEARTSTLIGVFISVTTIPAAADVGVSVAFGNETEAVGSLGQLLLNVALLAAVAGIGIPAQRAIWQRITH